MRLSAKVVKNYYDTNRFSIGNQWEIRAGDPNALYFQLVDLDLDGLRYMAGLSASASINVTFPSVDDSESITVAATQNTNDKSIWSIVLPTDKTPKSGNVLFSVTEGAATRKFSALNLISVEYPGEDGSC